MTTIFDQVRTHTNSLKWDRYRNRDILSMWVAGMGFRSSPDIIGILQERIEQGVFGYANANANANANGSDTLVQQVVNRLQKHYEANLAGLAGLVTRHRLQP